MSRTKKRISLRTKILFVFFVIIVVSNMIMGTVIFTNVSASMTQGVNAQFAQIADNLANQISAINEKEFAVLHAMADMDIIRDQTVPIEEKQARLGSVVKNLGERYENLAYYDSNGDAILGDGRRMNFGTRAYFTEAIAGKDYVSDPTLSPVTNTILQHYSVPVFDQNNKPVGAIVLVVNGNTLYDKIKDIDLGGGMHPAVISRRTGNTIANANENTDESSSDTPLAPDSELGKIIANIGAGKTGQEVFLDPSIGIRMISAYEPVPGVEWSVFAVAPYDYYFASLKRMQTIFMFIFIATIIIANLIEGLVLTVLFKPLESVQNSIKDIATGNADLTKRLPVSSNDEIGDVVTSFNQFVEKLQKIVTNLLNSKKGLSVIDEDLQASTQDASASITQIIANIQSVNGHILTQADSVQETAGAVNEISSNIQSLERMIENQANGVSTASTAVEEMIGNINSVNAAVGKMISSFSLLEQNTTNGVTSQSEANDRILEIDEQSKMLQDANTAIASIAEQTNLLAMNAAIEAAHAGEAGKGFSVVADEIRKLSETSATQSKTIGSELGKIQETIKNVVAASTATNTAFSSVSKSITETSQIIEQIRGAMEEQQIGSKQIIDALSEMNNSTSEVKLASTEMTEGNKQILAEIEKLQNATDKIKESVQEMHVGATRINDTGSALTTISSKVSGSIDEIGKEIGLFKV